MLCVKLSDSLAVLKRLEVKKSFINISLPQIRRSNGDNSRGFFLNLSLNIMLMLLVRMASPRQF